MNNRFERRRASGGRSEFQSVLKWVPLLIGGAIAAYGLSRRSKSGLAVAAAGGAVAYTGFNREANPTRDFARSSVLINKNANDLYRFWRNFENLPRFMHHLESVTNLDGDRSRWVAVGPANRRVEWTAEIVSETPDRLLVWRSIKDSPVMVDGSIEFREAESGRGTIVDAVIQYRTPAGTFGGAVAKIFGKDPAFLMEQDLRRFKALMETGEIPTTEGQSHGPRSAFGAAAYYADPDRGAGRKQTSGSAAEEANRRVS
jgi:uncharacterized membrane protein